MKKLLLFLFLLFQPFVEIYADTYIGVGQWTDPFFTSNDAPYTINVTVHQTISDKIYRIKSTGNWEYFNPIVNCENSKAVYIEPYCAKNSNGDIVHIIQLCKENGCYLNNNGTPQYFYGTLSDGIIRIPGESFMYYFNDDIDNRKRCDSGRELVLQMPKGYDYPIHTESGVYMGITSFNNDLNIKEISILNENTKSSFESFVNNMQMDNATLLYYAVDQAIDHLEKQRYPSNLTNATLITFTDGLDQGSLAMKPEYRTSKGYATHLAERIKNTQIQGCSLEAYAIGLKSDDVVDDELFLYNLESLASDPQKNIASVNNVNELQEQLFEIVENLNKTNTHRVIHLTVPMMSHGEKYRFTLDGAENANSSLIWFEGVFNIDNMCLENVFYRGFISPSVINKKLQGTVKGVNVSFTLTDCMTIYADKLLDIQADDIDEWTYLPSHQQWQHNVENTKNGDLKIEEIKSSFVIMFALDSSSSLGNLFPLIKSTANSFIEMLASGKDDTKIQEIQQPENLDIHDPEVEIYNLQGLQVTKPSKGIYILRKGSVTKKVNIR